VALPEFYHRSAVAVSQALHGYDEDAIRRRLDDITVGIAFGPDVPASAEGRALLDLLTRLLARLYPRLSLLDDSRADHGRDLADLARSINPMIDLADTDDATITVTVGAKAPHISSPQVFAGSDDWRGMTGIGASLPVGLSDNPCGAGVAAALAVANVFRRVFTPEVPLDNHATLSGLPAAHTTSPRTGARLSDATVLCGLGAVGQAAMWCLARCNLSGSLHVVDDEAIELDNLQRYVLTDSQSPGVMKTEVAAQWLGSALTVHPHPVHWADFVASNGYAWEEVLVAVDNAKARRQVQAGLPAWIANAWTQRGDLGVSRHRFNRGACLSCLYQPQTAGESEDAIIAAALGLPEPANVMRLRELLYRGEGAPRDLLELVASRRQDIDLAQILRYEGRPIRELYREGFCGGTVLPIGKAGTPRADVHVPLAHQSALAGVLLASALVSQAEGCSPRRTDVLRVDVMRPLPTNVDFQPLEAEAGGPCTCQDADYRRRYKAKWPEEMTGGADSY
jgi:Prokaryotic E2 family C/ThiF family